MEVVVYKRKVFAMNLQERITFLCKDTINGEMVLPARIAESVAVQYADIKAKNLIHTLHSYNKLTDGLLKIISEVFSTDGEGFCEINGITYDLEEDK